jgi:chromosome segregation ATPase
MSREEEDLATHVSICEIRYKGIQEKMDRMEQRMDVLESSVKDLREDTDTHFNEIKQLLVHAKDEKFKVMVGAASTVIVALLGMLGYVITHLAK